MEAQIYSFRQDGDLMTLPDLVVLSKGTGAGDETGRDA